MTGLATQNNTINGGSWGLVCLRRIPAEPFKNSQPTYSVDFFFSFLIIGIFVTSYILTPNELDCLIPAAIRRSVVYQTEV